MFSLAPEGVLQLHKPTINNTSTRVWLVAGESEFAASRLMVERANFAVCTRQGVS